MNLDELLKVNSVRCIKTKVQQDLVEGEIYKVEGFNDETIKIVDRNGFSSWHNKNLFEPVLDNNIDKGKLDELLKASKVRCVTSYDERLTVGKEYDVVGTDVEIQVKDDDDGFSYWGYDCFEPVPNNDVSNDTKNDNIFKVGDKVYKFGDAEVKTILEVFENGYMNLSNYPHMVNHESICYATQENYERLCKLYPHIEFELPPKEITRSDLTKIMFERGDFAVVCKCSNIGECSAIASSTLRLVIEYDNGRFLDNTGHLWDFAVPCNPKTNLPLTEDVLNDIN